ncbi:dihydroorotate dehydrogenase [bacterium]|nr:dihydroorotate dehydrogenase [bacterium]
MDSRLKTDFLGSVLKTPLLLPAGVMGISASSLLYAVQSGAGIVTTKSLTLQPRKGHDGPVISPVEGGFINAMGLCNPGIEFGIKEISEFKIKSFVPVIASVFATEPEGFVKLTEFINDSEADFIELNLSCPNVSAEYGVPLSSSPVIVEEVVRAVTDISKIPVIAKLSPNVPDIKLLALAAEKGGASALCLINTLGPGMEIDINIGRPVLKNIFGGMSGPCVKPIAVKLVYEASSVVKIPIIGLGGIMTGADAVEMLMAGASIIGIGTGIYYRGMDIYRKVNNELNEFLMKKDFKHIDEIKRINIDG